MFCTLVLMSLVTNVMTMPLVLAWMPGTELEPFIRASRSKPGVADDL